MRGSIPYSPNPFSKCWVELHKKVDYLKTSKTGFCFKTLAKGWRRTKIYSSLSIYCVEYENTVLGFSLAFVSVPAFSQICYFTFCLCKGKTLIPFQWTKGTVPCWLAVPLYIAWGTLALKVTTSKSKTLEMTAQLHLRISKTTFTIDCSTAYFSHY